MVDRGATFGASCPPDDSNRRLFSTVEGGFWKAAIRLLDPASKLSHNDDGIPQSSAAVKDIDSLRSVDRR